MTQTAKKWPMRVLVEVHWMDSASRARWGEKEDYLQLVPVPCRTAGYLLKKNATEVVIVQSQCEEGEVNAGMTIPRACVTKIRRLT